MKAINKGLPPQEQLVKLLEQVQKQILAEIGGGIKPIAEAVVGLEKNVSMLAEQQQVASGQIAQQAELTARLSKLLELSAGAPPGIMPGNDQFPPVLPPPIGPAFDPGMVAPPGVPVA